MSKRDEYDFVFQVGVTIFGPVDDEYLRTLIENAVYGIEGVEIAAVSHVMTEHLRAGIHVEEAG